MKIEDYLVQSQEKYDTVYLDTWDNLTHRYLPHINYLVQRSERVLEEEGEVIVWGLPAGLSPNHLMKVFVVCLISSFVLTAKSFFQCSRRDNNFEIDTVSNSCSNFDRFLPLRFHFWF